MAISWSTILKAMPYLASAMLPGFVGASRAGKLAAARLPARLKGAAFDYPSLPQDFDYPVIRDIKTTTVNGETTQLPSLNSSLDRSNLKAALVQDLLVHNQAVADGTERLLEEWWPGQDTKPRRTISPSSSAVEGIRIGDDGSVYVKWFNGDTWYKYRAGRNIRESSEMVQSLLSEPSIGRALVRNGRLAHKDSKDLTGKPVADKNVGWWGRKYYNPDYKSTSPTMYAPRTEGE